MVDPIQIESPAANINRARYSSHDFFTFLDDIVARIQALFVTEFNDFVTSGTGQMLIDIVAWACETLSFYIDRQASESYLETALTRKGISRLARQLGYKMSAAVAATVDLDVNLAEIQAFDVTIPVGFQFQGPNDLVFETVEEVTFPAGEGPNSPSRTVGVREGQTRVEIFTSDGTKNQSFRLNPRNSRYVAGDGFVCRVDGVPWTESDLITFDATDQFEVNYNDVPPTLRFGNGIAGNIPSVGNEIRTEYVATAGKAGAVKSGTITDVVSPLVIAATIIPLNITNPLPTTSGADREDLDRARTNASRYYKARDVAVTREDYEGLSLAYVDALAGAVAVAQAFVAHSAADDIQLAIYLDNIRNIVNPLEADVTAATTQIETDRVAINTARGNADTAAGNMTADLTAIDSAASTARGKAQSQKNNALNGIAQVDAYGPAGSADLSAPQVTSITNFFNTIDGNADSILTELGNIDVSTDDVVTKQGSVQSELAAMVPLLTSIQTQVAVIDARMTTSFETAVETELDNIYDHVDGFLSADCKANLVQVPILTRDVDGFLIEPPIALIRSLESYLDERKEVTQVVEVMSGGNYLIPVVISGTIGVLPGYVRQTVLSNVLKAIDDLLRVREFGASLRVSDLDTVASPNPQTGVGGVDGVKYSVLKIDGWLTDPTDPTTIDISFIDASGNLIIESKYVITKGLVTIVTEEAVA